MLCGVGSRQLSLEILVVCACLLSTVMIGEQPWFICAWFIWLVF